jgi:hypothetical protein
MWRLVRDEARIPSVLRLFTRTSSTFAVSCDLFSVYFGNQLSTSCIFDVTAPKVCLAPSQTDCIQVSMCTAFVAFHRWSRIPTTQPCIPQPRLNLVHTIVYLHTATVGASATWICKQSAKHLRILEGKHDTFFSRTAC